MSALADAGLTKRRLADGVMQATGPPSCAPVNDGPVNCRPYLVKTTGRTTVRKLAFVNLSVYLSQKVRIFISFITLFPDPGTGSRVLEAGTLTSEQERWDKCNKIAGTDVIHMNSHSRTPGQRVGRDTHAGTWIMDIVIVWPHTI